MIYVSFASIQTSLRCLLDSLVTTVLLDSAPGVEAGLALPNHGAPPPPRGRHAPKNYGNNQTDTSVSLFMPLSLEHNVA